MQLAIPAPNLLESETELNCVLHHVGFVVESINNTAEGFALSLGTTWDGKIFEDHLQRVKVTFLVSGKGASLELVEPCGMNSPAASFGRRGGGLHHVCYEVPALDEQLRAARSSGGIVVKPPLPAVAFEGRRIAWVFTRYKLLIEYLERKK